MSGRGSIMDLVRRLNPLGARLDRGHRSDAAAESAVRESREAREASTEVIRETYRLAQARLRRRPG